jgi:hypothetical protein
MKYTIKHYEAHLGLTGRMTCYIPEEVANDQVAYDGKTFPAIISSGYNRGKKIRVKLIGSDYALGQSGTGDVIVRRA